MPFDDIVYTAENDTWTKGVGISKVLILAFHFFYLSVILPITVRHALSSLIYIEEYAVVLCVFLSKSYEVILNPIIF